VKKHFGIVNAVLCVTAAVIATIHPAWMHPMMVVALASIVWCVCYAYALFKSVALCVWALDWDSDYYFTSCGVKHPDNPEEAFRHCPYCGKEIQYA
jgi:NADH pyrophosphatase NudC (nudix superfamily)